MGVPSELEANINLRCSAETRRRVDEAAAGVGVSRTQWVLDAIDAQLRKTERSGRVAAAMAQPRRRMMVVGRTLPELCAHPPALRSAVGPDGSARCMLCNSSIRVAV